MRRPHVVPLTPRMIEILSEAGRRRTTEVNPADPLFSGPREGVPLSEMACLMLMKRMGYGDFTAHGLRATFKGWAMTETEFARELIALRSVTPDDAGCQRQLVARLAPLGFDWSAPATAAL